MTQPEITAGDKTSAARIERDGEWNIDVAKEFARHRQSSTEELRAEVERLQSVEQEARFLLARLRELDWSQDYDDFANSFDGHVEPSIGRLDTLLSNTSEKDG